MTKIALTDGLKQTALQQYHPYVNIELWSLEQNSYDEENNTEDIIIQDAANLKIIGSDIETMLATDGDIYLQEYQKYIAADCTNIIFTPFDEENNQPIDNIIIPYEYYKGVFYLRLPRFYRTISLHLLTRYYDASDDVVLFNTEDLIDYIQSHQQVWTTTGASRTEEQIDILGEGVGRYLIPLPQNLRKMSSIEIDVFYKYIEDTIDYNNYIGIIDTSMRGYKQIDGTDDIEKEIEDQKSLINQNQDNTRIINIAQRNNIYTQDDDVFNYCPQDMSFDVAQIDNEKYYEAIVKYSNDNIYIEEYNQRNNDDIDRIAELSTNNFVDNFIFAEWAEELGCQEEEPSLP